MWRRVNNAGHVLQDSGRLRIVAHDDNSEDILTRIGGTWHRLQPGEAVTANVEPGTLVESESHRLMRYRVEILGACRK